MDNSGLTITEIRLASKTTTTLLDNANYSSCLVGSAAGYEHGITRVPNDVDVLVMTDKCPEELKNFLVSADSSFYWEKPVTNPHASYRVLWYKFPIPVGSETPAKSCRIDLFTPGMIHLPRISADKIVRSDSGLPIMPFFPIVLHKIQAWKAHLASIKPWAKVKQENDINDIYDLLRVVNVAGVGLENHRWLDAWFLEEAVEDVQEYVKKHPETVHGWFKLGLLFSGGSS